MPVPFRIGIGKLFDKHFLALQVGNHFIDRDIVVGNGRCFTVTPYAHELQFDHQCGLVRFGAFGNGERMPET